MPSASSQSKCNRKVGLVHFETTLNPRESTKLKTFTQTLKMKTLKSLGFLAVGLLLAAPGAQAQVEINISGAVAFRDTSYHAIRALFGADLASQNTANAANVPVTRTCPRRSRRLGPERFPRCSVSRTVTVTRLLQRRGRGNPGSDTEPQRLLPGFLHAGRCDPGAAPVGHRVFFDLPAGHGVHRAGARGPAVWRDTDQPGQEHLRPGRHHQHHRPPTPDAGGQRLRARLVS